MSNLEQIFADMPIARLAQLGGKSVSEIAVYALGGAAGATRAAGAAKAGRGRKAATAQNGAKASGRGASVRTASGRGDFDTRVLEAIAAAGGPVRSVDIESKVGGTPEQRRAALHRLVASKKLKRAGQARATTYEAR